MDFLIIIGEFILVMFETETVSAEQSQSAIAIDHFVVYLWLELRSYVSLMVRQASLHVWKVVVEEFYQKLFNF